MTSKPEQDLQAYLEIDDDDDDDDDICIFPHWRTRRGAQINAML
jgi:hypothetical protein